ncbi:MAG: polysaccharide deacetylase family protein [Candidatus Hydrothermarchaeales archaeon]
MDKKIVTAFFLLLLFALFIFIVGNKKDAVLSMQEVHTPSVEEYDVKELYVALTFDYEDVRDNQGGRTLPAIFELLERHNATATFFVLGVTAEKYPDKIQEIYSRGYLLGMHTYYHNFPLFDEGEAALIGSIYNYSWDEEWQKSFKSEDAFYRDLLITQRVIMESISNAYRPRIFRAPSLVVNWTRNPAYFEVLQKAGIEIDSSIYQDFSNPRPYYMENGVVEIPVVTSEARLKNVSILTGFADRCAEEEVPFVMFAHPQKLTPHLLGELDRFLTILEDTYEIRYVTIADIPELYSNTRLGITDSAKDF